MLSTPFSLILSPLYLGCSAKFLTKKRCFFGERPFCKGLKEKGRTVRWLCVLFLLRLEELHQLEEVIGAAVSLRPIIADIDLLIRRPERRKVMDWSPLSPTILADEGGAIGPRERDATEVCH